MIGTRPNARLAVATILFAVTTVAHARKGNTEKAGDIVQILVPLTAYGSTLYMDDREERNQFYQSFLTTIVITHALKHAVNKHRPEHNGDYSFPSGHT